MKENQADTELNLEDCGCEYNCEDCCDSDGGCDYSEPYHLKVKIDGNELEFSCPDKETFETMGLKILKSTFGRYENL